MLALKMFQVRVATRKLSSTTWDFAAVRALSGTDVSESGKNNLLNASMTSQRRRISKSFVARLAVMGALARAES